jgi:hypothetical protein
MKRQRNLHWEVSERFKFREKLLLLHLSTTTPSIRHSHCLPKLASSPAQLVQACTPFLLLPASKSKSSFCETIKRK